MNGAAAQPNLHLTALNPHVASTIPRPGAFFLPRQHATSSSAQAGAPAATAWGVSAFAFQGTNAHALLALAGADSAAVLTLVNPRSTALAKERFWIGPEHHALVARVARVATAAGAAGSAVLFEADLLQPKHAFLWDHAVAGRPILPGAAFLEAAAGCLHTAAAAGDDGLRLLLASVTIPSPLELPAAAGSKGKQQLLLQCQVDVASGRVRIASLIGGASREHMHGTAAAAAVPPAQQQLPAAAKGLPASGAVALLLLAAAAGVQQQHASIGSIESSRQDGRVGGRGLNPACLDASFHLGALPAGTSAAQPQLRVPAAIAAYQVQGTSSSDAPQMLGGCQPVSSGQSSITNDYWLADSGCGAGSICRVAGLEARALGRLPSAARPAVAAAAAALPSSSASQGMLYEVAWVAAGRKLLAVSSNTAAVAFNSSLVDEQQLAACGTAALQLSGGNGGALLASSGMLAGAASAPVAPAAAVAAGLLQGFLKAAAQENASSSYAFADGDAYSTHRSAPGLLLSGSAVAAAAADVHGMATRAGAAFLPVLMPASGLSKPAEDLLQRQAQGAVVISGGTGTLGQLIAAFLASSSSDSEGSPHISLLGRSGRLGSSSEPAALLRTAAANSRAVAITVASCDAAAAEDAAAAVASATSQEQLSSLLHAGGVLADALLANLTVGAIRRAFAPKVSSLARLQAPVKMQPAVKSLLFSSVAALLGSPGQANYSAANAVLDLAAQRAQQQVRSRVWCLGQQLGAAVGHLYKAPQSSY